MSKAQNTGTGTGTDPKASPAGGDGGGEQDLSTLTNALRFERDKNQVLLNEIVQLEDELVNRQLADFEGVVTEKSRDFWREQLLSNREAALAALGELAALKTVGSEQGAVGSGEDTGRRPLHNRETARPVQRRGFAGEGVPMAPAADSTAVRIRNRAHELSKLERIPFSTAFRRAEREVGSV